MKKIRIVIFAVLMIIAFISIGCSDKNVKKNTQADDFPIGAQDKPAVENSIGIKLVYIPPGSFMQGSPEDELGRDDDEKQYKVTFTKGFYMSSTEVTQRQWTLVMGHNPSAFNRCGDNCPVENVSWEDVMRFIKALNTLENKTYRLPSEPEWEYAARAGSSTAFPNGNLTEPDCCFDPRMDKIGWYVDNSDNGTHPVAQKDPNKLGLYDMHGNVWEWCADWMSKYPFTEVTDPALTAEKGTYPTSEYKQKIRRGGAWNNYARFARSAFRSWYNPNDKASNIGFRIVMDIIEPAAAPVATPVEPVATPVEPVATPVEPAATPVEPAATPVEPAVAPVEPAATPP